MLLICDEIVIDFFDEQPAAIWMSIPSAGNVITAKLQDMSWSDRPKVNNLAAFAKKFTFCISRIFATNDCGPVLASCVTAENWVFDRSTVEFVSCQVLSPVVAMGLGTIGGLFRSLGPISF